MIDQNEVKKEITIFQMVILALSFYVLGSLLFQLVNKPSVRITRILDFFDFIVCIVFLFDFFFRLFTSKNKLKFLQWGWIDFISSIPTLDLLRWGRLVRVFRILRLLRAFKSTKAFISFLFKNRMHHTLGIVALISFFLIIFASIAILTFETSPNAHIHTIVDAIWWSFSSISSTGSGDAYPVSTPGKILAIILSITGVGLFSTLTAFVAKIFIEPAEKREEDDLEVIKKQLQEINGKIDRIENKLSDRK
jgi:voltage-gated potassium channel